MIDQRTSELCMSRSLLNNAYAHLKSYGLDDGDLYARAVLLEKVGEQHEEYLDLMYPLSKAWGNS